MLANLCVSQCRKVKSVTDTDTLGAAHSPEESNDPQIYISCVLYQHFY